MTPRPICGNCPPCLDALARIVCVGETEAQAPRPTAAGLERHARRFGPEQVAETAAELQVDVNVERPRARRRRSCGPSVRQRVAALVEAGHGVEVIAEMENLSPSRARRLVEEVQC